MSLSLTPTTAAPGALVKLVCTGIAVNRTMRILVDAKEVGQAASGSTNQISATITAPTTPGAHAVLVTYLGGTVAGSAALTVSAPVTTVPVLPAPTSTVTFDDNFSGGLVKWRHDFHPPGIARAMYDPALVTVGPDGHLHLAVEKRSDGWHGASCDAQVGGVQFKQLYGIEEVILRLPRAVGAWWGGPWDYDSSAAEIDGLEAGGRAPGSGAYGVDMAHCTVHFAGGGQWNGGGPVKVADLSVGWHVVRREWRSTFIAWSIDGVQVRRYASGVQGWVGKIPSVAMPLILDQTVDVDDVWPGMGPPDSTTPSRFEALVARVRVQK